MPYPEDVTYQQVTVRIQRITLVVDRKRDAVPRLHRFIQRGNHCVVERQGVPPIPVQQVRHRGKFATGWVVSCEYIPHAAGYIGRHLTVERHRYDLAVMYH